MRRKRHEIGVGLAAAFASAGTIDKYGGHAAALAYLVVVTAATPFILPLLSGLAQRVSYPMVVALGLAAYVALAVVFFVVYPHANSHLAGTGSDRDDAADLAGKAMLHGRYPYSSPTYLGNSISQFPGLIVLALPFVAAGHSAYAFLFWLPLWFVLVRALSRDTSLALAFTLLALVISPVFVREIVTGGDLVANSISVMLAAWLVWLGVERDRAWWTIGASLALGLTLSSRLNFLFVLPPLLVLVQQLRGTRATLAVVACVSAGFSAVTLPFYVGHEHEFTPLSASNHLAGFNGSIPGGARVVIGIGLVLSIGLALRGGSLGLMEIFGQTAVVQSFFLLAVVLLASVRARTLDLGPLVPGYGLPVLLLALGAYAATRLPRARREGAIPSSSS